MVEITIIENSKLQNCFLSPKPTVLTGLKSTFFQILNSSKMNHAISWFEIPSDDIDRAAKFYETIFGVELAPMNVAQISMRMFPIDDPMTGVGGAIVHAEGF